MKFSMDETMKHRIIGITVIISIIAVFLPALLKKGSERMDNRHIAIQLPPEPEQMAHNMADEEKVFSSIKVAHVELQKPDTARSDVEKVAIGGATVNDNTTKMRRQKTQSSVPPVAVNNSTHTVSEAPSRNAVEVVTQLPPSHVPVAKKPLDVQPKPSKSAKKVMGRPFSRDVERPVAQRQAEVVITPNPTKPMKSTIARGRHYSVQLGVFKDEKNADALMARLKASGFVGQKIVVQSKKHSRVYKVVVGDVMDKEKADALKRVILSQVHMNGFVVHKEMS